MKLANWWFKIWGYTVISSDVVLEKDLSVDKLKINEGVTLTTNGYRVFVSGTIRIDGVIKRSKR